MDRERIGRYTIVGELGRGTMGEVHRAHDPVLGRHVALKTLAVKAYPGEETLLRFQNEAKAAALLNHPNIVTVHDFGEEGGLLYMAMELLEGTDLRDAIDGDLLQSLEEKLDVMDGILAALDYAHAKGVVHRDVKPANVHLIGPWGRGGGGAGRLVKIMDFGLARVSTSEMTQEGIVLGTPNYMSPEQALGDKVDGRSDLFSTGAVLYELLTGHKPFEADSTPSVLFQVVHRQPPPVRRWAPEVPTGIVAVVNRALEKDREKRFATAGDMRSALAVARQALAPPAGPKAPPLPRPSRPVPPPLPPSSSPPLPKDAFSAPPPPVPPRPRVPTPQPMPSPLRTPPPPEPPVATSPGRSLRPLLLGGGVALAAIAAVAAFLWLRSRPGAAPSPAPVAESKTVDALTHELVRKQVRLAQRELEDKNYASAIAEAEGALRLAPHDDEGRAVLAAARESVARLEGAVSEGRQRLDAGDTAGASAALSRLLEIDPRHPAATELSGRLNSAFRAQAEEASASARSARQAALAAGVTVDALRTADEGARRAETLAAKEEFAEATRAFLEARDAFDRARRAAPPPGESPAARGPAPAAATPAPRAPAPVPPTGAPPASSAAVPAGPVPAAPAPAARGFTAEATSVVTASAGGVAGFESSDVDSRRPPQFAGRVEFEVLPAGVRAGEPFVVRIHLRNDGRKGARIRAVSLATVVDGRRSPVPAKPLLRDVPPLSRALVAEYSGEWADAGAWALEAVVTVDRNEAVTSRLRAD
jgi:serine/threonine protein kinase